MEPEGPLPYSQVPATHPYPEPTPSSPHDPLQLPEHPSYTDSVYAVYADRSKIWKIKEINGS
jgi:hypothetical protein